MCHSSQRSTITSSSFNAARDTRRIPQSISAKCTQLSQTWQMNWNAYFTLCMYAAPLTRATFYAACALCHHVLNVWKCATLICMLRPITLQFGSYMTQPVILISLNTCDTSFNRYHIAHWNGKLKTENWKWENSRYYLQWRMSDIVDWRGESLGAAYRHASFRSEYLFHSQVSNWIHRFLHQFHVWSLGW